MRLESRWRGRADVAWDWSLSNSSFLSALILKGLVGLGAVVLKISPIGPGAGWARCRRLVPAIPHLRELAPLAKNAGFEISDFLEFENITKRDIKREISATPSTVVRNGMP